MQASLFGYVEMDYPLAPKEQAEAYEKKTAEVEAQDCAFAPEDSRAGGAVSLEAGCRRSTRSIPENVQHAIAIPEDKRTPGEALLADQVIRTTSVSSG